MSKRIILLLDGTWNDADSGPADTNIVRLREIISKCLDVTHPMKVDVLSPGSEARRTSISTGTFSNKEHLIFYERGVGTGIDREEKSLIAPRKAREGQARL